MGHVLGCQLLDPGFLQSLVDFFVVDERKVVVVVLQRAVGQVTGKEAKFR